MSRGPCDVCKRVHRGRCSAEDDRTVRMCLALPGHLDRRLRDHVDFGDRSGFVAALIEAELDRVDA